MGSIQNFIPDRMGPFLSRFLKILTPNNHFFHKQQLFLIVRPPVGEGLPNLILFTVAKGVMFMHTARQDGKETSGCERALPSQT